MLERLRQANSICKTNVPLGAKGSRMAAMACHGKIWMVASPGLGGGFRNVPHLDQEVLIHPALAQSLLSLLLFCTIPFPENACSPFIDVATVIPIIFDKWDKDSPHYRACFYLPQCLILMAVHNVSAGPSK